MTYLKILGYPLLIVSALEIILGIILLRHNPHNSRTNKSVAAFSLFSAGYSLFSGLILIRSALGLDVDLYARANWIGWFNIPAALQFLYYLRSEDSKTARRIGYILYPFWGVMYLLSFFTDLIVTPGYSVLAAARHVGPLENPVRFIGGISILWIMYEIIILRKQVQGIRRIQLNYFFHGTLIFGIGAASLPAFMQVFGGLTLGNELGSYFGFPWVMLTFYAIMRYSLFDLRIILSRTLSAILIWFGFTLVHLWLTDFLSPHVGNNLALMLSLSLLGFLFFGTPLLRLVQTWMQRIIVKDRYDYQEILRGSINAVITILDRDRLLEYIIESIRTSMGIDAVYLYWRTPDGRYTRRHGFGPLLVAGKEIVLGDAAVDWLRRERQSVIREELETTLPGEESRSLAKYLYGTGIELLIPMVYKDELQGVLALGQKVGRDAYRQSDLGLLETLAGHAAVAMENAQLYEEAVRIKETLHESEEKFRTLANTLPAAIFIHRGGKFLYANPAGMRVTGYSMEEILNMDFWGVTHPDYRNVVVERARGRLDGTQPTPQYEIKIVRKDGEERWVLMTAGMIEYEGKPAVIGTIFDITDRKLAEEEKARLYEENVTHYQEKISEEERHQREKEKLLRDLHDGIGGITTNINLLAEMAKSYDSLSKIKKTLTTIADLAREGLADIRGFMHSLDAKDMSWQSLAAEFRNQGSNIIESHGMTFELRTVLSVTGRPPGSLFCLNLFKIYKEALTNIVKHARAKSVYVAMEIRSDNLALSVSDDGIGLAKTEGGGRGLSNMKSRTRELGGELSIVAGKGTTIQISLPIPENYPGRGMD